MSRECFILGTGRGGERPLPRPSTWSRGRWGALGACGVHFHQGIKSVPEVRWEHVGSTSIKVSNPCQKCAESIQALLLWRYKILRWSALEACWLHFHQGIKSLPEVCWKQANSTSSKVSSTVCGFHVHQKPTKTGLESNLASLIKVTDTNWNCSGSASSTFIKVVC